MITYTKEEMLNGAPGLTVGELLKFIKEYDIPDSAPVLVQRVEDRYYEGVDVSGMRGPNGILPPGSKANGWKVYRKAQGYPSDIADYHPAWSCVYYKEDKEILFIDLHY